MLERISLLQAVRETNRKSNGRARIGTLCLMALAFGGLVASPATAQNPEAAGRQNDKALAASDCCGHEHSPVLLHEGASLLRLLARGAQFSACAVAPPTSARRPPRISTFR